MIVCVQFNWLLQLIVQNKQGTKAHLMYLPKFSFCRVQKVQEVSKVILVK